MLTTETFLALYYLGFGFVIFLLWAVIAQEADDALAPSRRRRLHQLAFGLATVGVLHPGLALAGRDLAVQLGRADRPHDARAAGTLRLTSGCLGVGLGLAALVAASHLGPLEDVPILRQLRRGLPFA